MWLAIGIIGATVMPHNLYLHSALVQSRKLQGEAPMVRRAIRFNTIDHSDGALVAFFVNAAILVLAAIVFDGKGVAGSRRTHKTTDWIRVAYLHAESGMRGGSCTLFAMALLASGQSSTITGTLAGQVVMEGFMQWRMRPWVRRMITRMLAILPGHPDNRLSWRKSSVTDLLVLGQVVLAIQLPLAMFPLMHFTSSKSTWGSTPTAGSSLSPGGEPAC